MKNSLLLKCEKPSLMEKIKMQYQKNSMLYKFYLWLAKDKKNAKRPDKSYK